MAGEIFPIELGLTDGNCYTLWAPRWRDGDDEWEAFLGLDEDLFTFSELADLIAFVRTNDDNDLVDHPSWKALTKSDATDFRPTRNHKFDLIAVPELAASEPTPKVIAELENALEISRIIGEVCELSKVTKFFGGNPILGAVTIGTDNFAGRTGKELWQRIGRLINKYWDDVIDSIDDIISTPAVNDEEVTKAALILDANPEPEVDDDDDLDLIDLDDDDDLVDEDIAEEELDDDDDFDESDFWATVGIDPISITTGDKTVYSLRCYLGDDPIFLGRKGKIFTFDTTEALIDYLSDDPTGHEMSTVSTYHEVTERASDNELDVTVTAENTYDLNRIDEDITDGPRRINRKQLELAVELLVDAGDFAKDETPNDAFNASAPLGWFVDYSLNPDPKRLAPSAPFDNEAEAWQALVHDFTKRLVNKGA